MAYIGIDFDNTCVRTTEFPKLGEDVEHCISVLKRLVNNGHKLMLFTQREHVSYNGYADILEIALSWFKENDIPLYTINENAQELTDEYYPAKKPGWNFFIDDRNLGTKLVNNCVDWYWVEEQLINLGIL